MAQPVDKLWGSRSGRTLVLLVNVVYANALAGVSMMSSPPWVPVLSQNDWLAHGLAYFVQTLLLFPLVRGIIPPLSAIAAAAGTAMFFGAFMEVIQLAIPGRFFELQDLLANIAGITVAVAILAVIGQWSQAQPEDASG